MGGEDSAFSYVRLKYGENATDTVSGTIVYPDDFSFSEVGVASIAFGARPLTQINSADWEALENAGCIFLPSTSRSGYATSGLFQVQDEYFGLYLFYWLSTSNTASHAGGVYFGIFSKELTVGSNYNRNRGFSVRLVQDL